MNMSWSLVLWLSIGAYLFKMMGLVVVGSRNIPEVVSRCLMLIPAALLCAMVINGTFTDAQTIVVDERAIGLLVAILAARRKLPLIVVVVLAAATTALLRAM